MRIQIFSSFAIIILSIISSIILISAQSNPFPTQIEPAEFSSTVGWSCDDFPCEDDVEGFLERIQVPAGFGLTHLGQFPGQPMQIVYGDDGRLYATILEKGTRRGAVYAMDVDGNTERVSPRFWSPVGIAFDENGALYVSGRMTSDRGGAVWRVASDLTADLVVSDLPCCYGIDNQPNGMVFGADGSLYLGIGSTTDRGESTETVYATPQPFESSIIKIDFDSGTIETVADGIRNPYDLTFTSQGQLYATDNGLVTGEGDRLLRIEQGAFYGFPYWRTRGCAECPPREGRDAQDDWLTLPNYTLPRGIVAYDGAQFPANMLDTLFVAFWNGVDGGQRIVWIDPDDSQLGEEDYTPQPFVTGLIRPVDVTIAPDGSLVVADFVYGHIWQIAYMGGNAGTPLINTTDIPADANPTDTVPPIIATVVSNADGQVQPIPATPTTGSAGIIFATSTPSN